MSMLEEEQLKKSNPARWRNRRRWLCQTLPQGWAKALSEDTKVQRKRALQRKTKTNWEAAVGITPGQSASEPQGNVAQGATQATPAGPASSAPRRTPAGPAAGPSQPAPPDPFQPIRPTPVRQNDVQREIESIRLRTDPLLAYIRQHEIPTWGLAPHPDTFDINNYPEAQQGELQRATILLEVWITYEKSLRRQIAYLDTEVGPPSGAPSGTVTAGPTQPRTLPPPAPRREPSETEESRPTKPPRKSERGRGGR
ncbi:MAG: hypothetical protein M1822_009034 [Bathelium mastoideum]|nr:MAG: hypothetical protein M1822_009034 [Bathelium mastoideum]